MRKLVIQSQARLDLLDIWHHIAKDNLAAAIRVGEELDAEILGLLDLPAKGHRRSDTPHQYRFWRVYSYFIAYRFNDMTGSVTIVRVVHGHRNFRKIFGTGG